MLVSDSALDYFTGHLDVLWKVPLAVAAARRVLRGRSASRSRRSPIAASSRARRSSGCSSSRRSRRAIIVGDFELDGGSAGRADQRARAAAVPARPRVPRPHRPRRRRSAAWPTAGCSRSSTYVVVLLRRRRRAAAPLPLGGTLMAAPEPDAGDRATIRRSSPTRRSTVADVSVWFGPKVALSELSCSFGPGVTGLLGPNGAGKTTLMRAITGLVGVNQGTVRVEGRDPRRDREVHRRHGAGARGRSGAGRAHRPPVRALRRRPARRRRPRARPTTRCDASGCSTSPTGASTTFSKGMRQRTKVAAALVMRSARARARRAAERRRPGAARAPHRAVQAARRARAAP